MNVFTNIMTAVFYFFTKYCERKFEGMSDPATGEVLTEKNKKFELRKVLELPWTYWGIMLFTLFETSGAIVFTANATELAQLRFGTSAITAGWYTSLLQYAGFFVVPCVGIFVDFYGNRLIMCKYVPYMNHSCKLTVAQWLFVVQVSCYRCALSIGPRRLKEQRQLLDYM